MGASRAIGLIALCLIAGLAVLAAPALGQLQSGANAPPTPMARHGEETGPVRDPVASEAVTTTIILGKPGDKSAVSFGSPARESGIQINVERESDPERARRIAAENLEAGRVGTGPDRIITLRPADTRTTVRADDVVVKSKPGKSKACVSIGVVGSSGGCSQ
ncbi:hypothetical protein [Thalassobaculum salexigens]|uniref:hypothetical protein n=1 Tax=Thalassobaculum salexigens TaxID=455360 RepID=UPI00248D6FA7|nr:hypothetical protein [Thalassobaculum salexigens]